MQVRPSQKTTKLGTALTFEVADFRGTHRFPKGQEGLVFLYEEKRVISDKYTGLNIHRDERYAIRTDDTGQGWRIDRRGRFCDTAVYGLGKGRPSYWPTNHEAAAALEAVLEEIRTNSSVGTL